MSNKITTTYARKNFTDIINRVSYGDESFVLTKRGEPIAALVSMKELELLHKIKDQIDVEDTLKAENELDDPIPWGDLIKDLGF